MWKDHLLFQVAAWLEEERTRYAIVGGVAVVRYGFLRETKDIDVLVAMPDLESLVDRLRREGFVETQSDGENFQVYRRGVEQRIDLLHANNAFLRKVLDQRAAAEFEGTSLEFVAVEHLVAMKMKALAADPRRAQDLKDVKRLLAMSTGESRRRIEGVLRMYRREDLL